MGIESATGAVTRDERLPHRVSVVIPTLGSECVVRTIEQLNRGTLVPAEILACIPQQEAARMEHVSFPNVRVVRTDCRGQVAQRAIGFQQAREAIVVQLDDDIHVEEDTLARLTQALADKGRGNALAPVFHVVETGRCTHELGDGLRGWLMNLFTYAICGAPWGVKRMGVVTAIGTSYGVDSRHCGSAPFPTQWLPGGCVVCFREDLIRDNFFPYAGKAYCEDLIHSHLRVKNGTRLWVLPTAKCLIHASEPERDARSVLAQLNARRYVLALRGGPKWRLALYEALSGLKRAVTARARAFGR